ncbi:MAG TPA: hypothetical protein VMT52_04735, partial [Planctomycetota bacterium]|nr:hypothetical protein [Planctomycetota bacterium]
MTSAPSTVRRAAFRRGAARGIALFLGGFSLLNLLGELRSPGFDANPWWIDLRLLPTLAGRALLLIGALLLVAFALRPPTSPWRRLLSRTVILVLLGFTFWNVVAYYIL